MRAFANLPLQHKLAVLLAPAAAALIALSVTVALERHASHVEMRRVEEHVALSVRLGDLVHELQKERGLSAAWLGSGGSRFGDTLRTQRAAVDARIAAVQSALADAGIEPAQLASLRAAVDGQRIGTAEEIARYTRAIAPLLETIERGAHGEFAKDLMAYASLLQQKERAGQERAALSAVFAADRFSPGELRRIAVILGEQATYERAFLALAPDEHRRFYEERLRSPEIRETERMRESAFERAGGRLGMDPQQWFARMTARIDRLKEIEDRLAADLTSRAGQAGSQAHREMILFAILAFVVPILGVGAALVIRRCVLRRLAAAVDVTARIADGRYDNPIDCTSHDEIGQLLAALRVMQEKLARHVRELRDSAEESLRVRTALDNASACLMVADRQGRIIYANRSLVNTFGKVERDLRKVYPEFDAGKLIGTPMERYHPQPAQVRALLDSLTETHRVTFRIGDATFALAASPVRDTAGNALGTCVEWRDLTDELRVQDEVRAIVEAAEAGDLVRRLTIDDRLGTTKPVAEAMNRLLDTLSGTLNDVAAMLDCLARGDLGARMSGNHRGIFRRLQDDLNRTAETLTGVTSRIKNAAGEVRHASSTIALGNSELSQRTQGQAAALEETAASMEELTATARNNADNTSEANRHTHDACERARRGHEVLERAMGAMNAIEDAGRQIAEITGMVDSIAFQTNLLSLNAAVEAAHAGELGRGFAVVATEVRNLAGRSAQATKQIKDLIADTVERVQTGAELMNQSAETLTEIVASTKKAAELVSSIATATQEQSAGIAQINQAVRQMDLVTQRNAALVEQTTASAMSLEGQARNLDQLMDFFTIDDTQHNPADAAKRAA
jgi:methyl-accepting chemotaxis protein